MASPLIFPLQIRLSSSVAGHSGEVCRSGCCFQRGLGRVFFFRPGHETYPIFYQSEVQQVIENAVRWAAPDQTKGQVMPRKLAFTAVDTGVEIVEYDERTLAPQSKCASRPNTPRANMARRLAIMAWPQGRAIDMVWDDEMRLFVPTDERGGWTNYDLSWRSSRHQRRRHDH